MNPENALAWFWQQFNYDYFEGRLAPPSFALTRGISKLGSWRSDLRQLSLSEELIRSQPWEVVLEVLKHEMAHQYCDEVLKIREAPHGPFFQAVCRARGVDPNPRGIPTAGNADSAVVRKVRALLALATSPEQHEAEAAMNAARRLMLKHNLAGVGQERRYVSRLVGQARLRHEAVAQVVGGMLPQFFFVTAIWVKTYDLGQRRIATALEISGTEENVDFAEYVHSFLFATLDRLWARHRRERGNLSSKGKRDFQLGVMLAFTDKLARERKQDEQTGLVWVADPGLEQYFNTKHPQTKEKSSLTYRNTEDFKQGTRHGEDLVIHRPVEDRGEGGVAGLIGGR
ncbi:MAG: DUF2786 domain-containing protein [Deltaproteobacteria bacterium]|nr:DUF2786 domain-containing protein [Deltaproteobacteria bacterium]